MESPIQAQHINPHPQQLYHSNQSDVAMRPRKVIGKFFLFKTLGRGSMGKVKLALNTETNEKVI